MKRAAIERIMGIFVESTGLHWSVSGRIAYEITEEGLLHGLHLDSSSYSTAELAEWFSLPLFMYNPDLVLSWGERIYDRKVSPYYEFDERGLESEADRLAKNFIELAVPALARQYSVADFERVRLRGRLLDLYEQMASVSVRVQQGKTYAARMGAVKLARLCDDEPENDLVPWSRQLVDVVLGSPHMARDFIHEQIAVSVQTLGLRYKITRSSESSLLHLAGK